MVMLLPLALDNYLESNNYTSDSDSMLTKHGDRDRGVWWCQVQGTNALLMSETQADQVQKCQSPTSQAK